VLPESATDVIIAVSITAIVLNPLASRVIEPAERFVMRLRRGTDVDGDESATSSSLDPQTRAIVIGYGPTGRTVTRLLRENGISPTVVELNMDTVRQLRQSGISAVYGDARHPDSLITAGLRHAGNLIISGDAGARDITQIAREINSRVHIFVRSVYLRDVPPLRSAGAEQVFSGEGEVALAMTEAVLRRLGATADQIDRERDRVRAELFQLPVQ
jgi:CPA2 family monovalent cation:H+ antiporter-2